MNQADLKKYIKELRYVQHIRLAFSTFEECKECKKYLDANGWRISLLVGATDEYIIEANHEVDTGTCR